MKKIVILSVILCLFLTSCIKEREYTTFYKIINKSSREIKIRIPNYFFYSSITSIDTTFHLLPNQQLEYDMRGGGDDNATRPFNNADTVFIIFNDKDTVGYTQLDTSPRNILKRENYQEKIDIKKHKGFYSYYYTYTFTDEDYLNAINKKE
jgi:hypothetical protein